MESGGVAVEGSPARGGDRGGFGEQLDVDAAMVRLSRLSATEALYEPRPNYIAEVQHGGMDEGWREKIVTWFNQLGESFRMSSETLTVATNYLDRYLSLKSVGSVNFQLVSIASIFLASKVEEPRPFRTADFVHLSNGVFSASDLRLMELELLCTLKWQLHPPTAIEFVHLLLQIFDDAVPHAGAVAAHALRYAELTRVDADFLKFPASMVAVASVICALKQFGIPMAIVARWMRRVQGCKLSYTDRDDAAESITACGLKLVALDGGDLAMLTQTCDAEVEHATSMMSSSNQNYHNNADDVLFDDDDDAVEGNHLAQRNSSSSASSDKSFEREENSHSPNDVMAIDTIENFEQPSRDIFDKRRPGDHHHPY